MSTSAPIIEALAQDKTIEQDLSALDSEAIFEMTNLPASRTGIAGVLFLSTAMGSHGPRIKYFVKTGKGQPSFSVSISEPPQVVANSLPERVLNQMAPSVLAWVRLNHGPLLNFWNEGQTWTIDELNHFVDALKKVPEGQ
jgi:hypothetical protein